MSNQFSMMWDVRSIFSDAIFLPYILPKILGTLFYAYPLPMLEVH